MAEVTLPGPRGPRPSGGGGGSTTGSGGASTTSGSGTSQPAAAAAAAGGGKYVVACNKGDGNLVVPKTVGSHHATMKSGFASEQAAIDWISANCPSWRCNKTTGACDTQTASSGSGSGPASGGSGVGTYSRGDVTNWRSSVWKNVGCSYGAPSVCWGSGGRTLSDGNGDGRADILLHSRIHWKNMGGSSSPSLPAIKK